MVAQPTGDLGLVGASDAPATVVAVREGSRTLAAVAAGRRAPRAGEVLGRVVRGEPVRRTRDVRVRLIPDEHAAWSAARAVTDRRELGAWVRVAVNELLSLPSGERLDRPDPVAAVVDAQTYLTLVAVANALGDLVARANAEQRYPAEQEASAVYEQVRQAAVEIGSAIAAATTRARRRQ